MLFISLVFLYWYLGRLQKKSQEKNYVDKSIHYNYYDNRTVNLIGSDKPPVNNDEVA